MATSDGNRPRPAAAKTATAAKRAAPRKRADADTKHKPTPSAVAARAAQQLLELTGREVEGVTGLSKADDGWTVQVEVLEAKRIPDTTDVLALYEVEVDGDAELTGYHRVRRYVRGKPSEG
jgi:hypothetical protein